MLKCWQIFVLKKVRKLSEHFRSKFNTRFEFLKIEKTRLNLKNAQFYIYYEFSSFTFLHLPLNSYSFNANHVTDVILPLHATWKRKIIVCFNFIPYTRSSICLINLIEPSRSDGGYVNIKLLSIHHMNNKDYFSFFCGKRTFVK